MWAATAAMLSSTRSHRSQARTSPLGHRVELEVHGRPGILRRPLASVGQPVPADGDVRRHDHVRGAEQAALANQAARGVGHRELVVVGAGVPEPGTAPGRRPAFSAIRSAMPGDRVSGCSCRFVQEPRTFWPCSRSWPCGPTYR